MKRNEDIEVLAGQLVARNMMLQMLTVQATLHGPGCGAELRHSLEAGQGAIKGMALNAGDEGAALAEFEKAASLPDAARMAGMLRLRREEFAPARRHLEAALGGLDRLGSLLEKYGVAAQVTFPVTPGVDAHARPRERGTRLALVEIAQLTGERITAMRHVERLLAIEPGDPVVLLSFAELALEGDADRAQLERIVGPSAGIANETPVDTALLLYRGRALARLGLAA